MSNPNYSTSTDDGVPRLTKFQEFCAKVRNSHPSILPDLGEPLRIGHRRLTEKEDIELADALLQNTNITNLEFNRKHVARRTTHELPLRGWIARPRV
jgi:hypothetical protein